jgi:ribosomal protein L10
MYRLRKDTNQLCKNVVSSLRCKLLMSKWERNVNRYSMFRLVTTQPSASLTQERRYPERKQYLFLEYTRLLEEADPLFVVQYSGISAKEWTPLRIRLDQEGGLKLKVTKTGIIQRLLKREASSLNGMFSLFHAPIAVVTSKTRDMSREDSLSTIVKRFCEIIGQDKRFYILGAKIENNVVALSEIYHYASLPCKTKLQEQLTALLESPTRALMDVLIVPSQHLTLSLEHHVKSSSPLNIPVVS